MDAWERLRPLRLFAAIAALFLQFLTGCNTACLIDEPPHEAFRGIRGAYLTRDELGIVYTTAGNRRHDQIAWFELRDLRRGPEKLPYVVGPENRPMWSNPETHFLYPERVERASGTLPEGAEELPASRATPSLPPGATIAVFSLPDGEDVKDSDHTAIVVVVSENGQVYRLRPPLPCPKYRPWWYYPALPAAFALDVVTFPLQMFACWVISWDPC